MGGRHMLSRKLHPCSVSALFFPIKSWLITNILNSFKPKLSCLTLRSQALVNVSIYCCSLRYFVVVVCRFIFYCETTARTVLPPCGKTDYCKITSVRMCDLSVQKLGGVRTVHTYCSDDAIRIMRTLRCPSRTRKSEVYFGLNLLLILSMRVNWHVVAKLLIVSKMLFYQLMYQTVSLNCNWLKNDSVS